MLDRSCRDCGSKTTYIDPKGYPQWHKDEGAYLCSKCYDKAFTIPKWGKRRISFKGKRPYVSENPRKGICQKCGKVGGRMEIHHIHYHVDDPLRDTIELCATCHGKETRLQFPTIRRVTAC